MEQIGWRLRGAGASRVVLGVPGRSGMASQGLGGSRGVQKDPGRSERFQEDQVGYRKVWEAQGVVEDLVNSSSFCGLKEV